MRIGRGDKDVFSPGVIVSEARRTFFEGFYHNNEDKNRRVRSPPLTPLEKKPGKRSVKKKS